MKKLLYCSFGFLILVNGLVLTHGYYNRQEVQARVTLSERELNFPGNYGFQKENSALSLSLRWNTTPDGKDDRDYFYGRDLQLSNEHYSTFGFAGSCNDDNARASEQGFVLMEFNGSMHRQVVARAKSTLDKLTQVAAATTPDQSRNAEDDTIEEYNEAVTSERNRDDISRAKDQLEEFETKRSRLYVIDAAASKSALQSVLEQRKKITGSQYLILPAIIADDYRSCETKQKNPNQIYINDLLVEHISVPREYHALFPDKNKEQQFQAVIAIGKLDEPWLESLSLCEKECKAQ